MKALGRFFSQRWVIGLIGVIALSIIVWFLGPLIKIADQAYLASTTSRLLVIMVLTVLWGLNNLRVQWANNRSNARMLHDISAVSMDEAAGSPGQSGDPAGDEVQVLSSRFRDALELLRKSAGKKAGRQYIYELPWYVIIGPPGSGKTTAIANSGLHFPLESKFGRDGMRGVGGTRNCDWFFTNEAVLLDTAGRYTTQDSFQAADASAWQGFLGLLKKNRPRRPINGAIVAFSVQDLLQLTEAERAAHAQAIRSRIDELGQSLGIRIPVYMLLTKVDLVAGFTEFFDELPREDRVQVWGTTFALDALSAPPDQPRSLADFPAEFDRLIGSLNDRVLWRLHNERDVSRRGAMFTFPQRMATLKDSLTTFLDDAFGADRYRVAPMLRGVYFASGTQEGSPIDRVLSGIAAGFGLPPAATSGAMQGPRRTFFLERLFTGVVFQEAEIAGVNRRVELRKIWLQRAAYVGAVAVAVLAGLAWSTSFTRNRMHIAAVDGHIDAYNQNLVALDRLREQSAEGLLSFLRPLRASAAEFGAERPFMMGLGLYQGSGIREAAESAYARVLQKEFLPRIGLRLEEQMQRGPQDPDYQMEALRSYLMLGYPEERLEPEVVELWMALDWEQRLPGEATKQQELAGHLHAALSRMTQSTAINLDERLIQSRRGLLAEVPLTERLYARLKAGAAVDLPGALRLPEALGVNFGKAFKLDELQDSQLGVARFFTYDGFHKYYRPKIMQLAQEADSDTWVLGTQLGADFTEADIAKVRQQVESIYLDEYIAQWRTLSSVLNVRGFADLNTAADSLRLMSASDSPLIEVLRVMYGNTQLEEESQLTALTGDKARQAAEAASELSTRADRLRRIAGRAGRVAPEVRLPERDVPGARVIRYFAPIHALMEDEGKGTPAVDAAVIALNEVFGYLNALASAPDPREAAYQAAGQRMTAGSSDAIAKLRQTGARMPAPLDRWLGDIADQAWRVVLSAAGQHVNRIWRATVLPEYQRSIAGRYPLRGGGGKEATLVDFERFFGPGQTMDSFVAETLKPFVDTRGWKLRAVDGRGFPLSSEALLQMRRAAVIKNTFFSGGGGAAVRFSLKPVFLDRNVSQVTVDVDGQVLSYRHGPVRSQEIVWPGTNPTGRSRVVFRDLNGREVSLERSGTWNWFRLLDQAKTERGSGGDRYAIEFMVEGRRTVWELRASSVNNPFSLGELKNFAAPQNL